MFKKILKLMSFASLAALLSVSAGAAPLYNINLHNHVFNGNQGTSGSAPVTGGPYHTTFNYTDGYGSGSAGPDGVVSHTELFLHPWIYGVNGDVSMRSRLTFDDVIFTDDNNPSNTGHVAVSVNLDLDGALTYAPTSGTPGMSGILRSRVSLGSESSLGELEAYFGSGDPSPGGTGMFAGESGSSLAGAFVSDVFLVPLNTELTLSFWVEGQSSVLGSFYTHTDRARVFADFSGSLALTPFNLPTGISASSVQGSIDQSATAVPAPATALLMFSAFSLMSVRRLGFGKRAGLARG